MKNGPNDQFGELPEIVRNHEYNQEMPMYMCRWPNGDLSFVSAPNKEEAIIMLDEWDNAEMAEISRVNDFMVDFRLSNKGELELKGFGESLERTIWERAFPLLDEARGEAFKLMGDEHKAERDQLIRKVVKEERTRLFDKKKHKDANTELGKSIQAQMGAPAALVNRYVKQGATEVLAKIPTTGRKQ